MVSKICHKSCDGSDALVNNGHCFEIDNRYTSTETYDILNWSPDVFGTLRFDRKGFQADITGKKRWTDEWIVLYEHLCPAVIYWKDKKDVFMLTGDRGVDIVVRKNGEQMLIPGDYSFSSYEKLTFLTPWYLRVRIRG